AQGAHQQLGRGQAQRQADAQQQDGVGRARIEAADRPGVGGIGGVDVAACQHQVGQSAKQRADGDADHDEAGAARAAARRQGEGQHRGGGGAGQGQRRRCQAGGHGDDGGNGEGGGTIIDADDARGGQAGARQRLQQTAGRTGCGATEQPGDQARQAQFLDQKYLQRLALAERSGQRRPGAEAVFASGEYAGRAEQQEQAQQAGDQRAAPVQQQAVAAQAKLQVAGWGNQGAGYHVIASSCGGGAPPRSGWGRRRRRSPRPPAIRRG